MSNPFTLALTLAGGYLILVPMILLWMRAAMRWRDEADALQTQLMTVQQQHTDYTNEYLLLFADGADYGVEDEVRA